MAGGGQDASAFAGLVDGTVVDGLLLSAAGRAGQVLHGLEHGSQIDNGQGVKEDL